MKINNEFTVSVSIQQAWDVMLDLQKIAPCLPGAAIQEEGGDSTKVNVETDMKLTGRAAQFGRGIAQDVATKMLNQFAECLEREISGGPGVGAAESAAPTETSDDSGDGAGSRETPTAAVGGAGGTAGRVISSEDPAVMAGGPVEGAVVSDGGTSGAAASAGAGQAGAEQAGAEQAAPREREEPEAFDIGAASQEAILKRVGPVLVGLGLLAFLIWLVRR